MNHIQGLFDAHCYDFKLALGGSYPLQVYLPESDMDVTVLTPDSENNDELTTVMQIFSCLCQAIKDNEKQNALPFAVDDAVSLISRLCAYLCVNAFYLICVL